MPSAGAAPAPDPAIKAALEAVENLKPEAEIKSALSQVSNQALEQAIRAADAAWLTSEFTPAGAFRSSCPGHHSELMLSVYNFGAGRFILNSLRVRQALGQDPTAERLLRNMLHYAARDAEKPLAELPADFEAQLKAIGYAR